MKKIIGVAVAMALSATAAQAHVGVDHSHGLVAGLVHPLFGLDHLSAMIAVGVFAAVVGGRAVWATPLAFVLSMILGGILAAAGVAMPMVEVMIAASVLVLGLVVAMGWKAPLGIASALVGTFAVFHGHAHVAEIPAAASGVLFGLGFVAATAALHVLGVVFALVIAKLTPVVAPRIIQLSGVAFAAIGAAMLGGMI